MIGASARAPRKEMQHWFTPEEVDALIPRLESLIGQLQRLSRRIRDAAVEMAAALGCDPAMLDRATLLEHRPDLRADCERLRILLEEIRQCGGIFRAVELGLVDFPARVGGEEVFLCWQYGEPAVAYYHRAEEGFSGRKPLPGRGMRVPPVH